MNVPVTLQSSSALKSSFTIVNITKKVSHCFMNEQVSPQLSACRNSSTADVTEMSFDLYNQNEKLINSSDL